MKFRHSLNVTLKVLSELGVAVVWEGECALSFVLHGWGFGAEAGLEDKTAMSRLSTMWNCWYKPFNRVQGLAYRRLIRKMADIIGT